VVSAVFSPPLLATAMIAIAAASSAEASAWRWALLGLTLMVLSPIGYLLWLYRQGLVSDLDVQRREERARPMRFTLAAMILAVVLFGLTPAPRILLLVTAAQVLQATFILVVTRHWKISVHGAAAAAFLALLLYLTSWQAALALLVLPLVLWSRIRLHRHTPAQTLAGTMAGGLITAWVLLLA